MISALLLPVAALFVGTLVHLVWSRPDFRANAWGFNDPSLSVLWREIADIYRVWHNLKTILVHWTRFNAQRAVKTFLGVIGLLMGVLAI